MINAWHRREQRRRNRDDARILGCLLQGDATYIDIWRRTGLCSAAVYPSLARMEADKRVRAVWLGDRRCYFVNYEQMERERGETP